MNELIIKLEEQHGNNYNQEEVITVIKKAIEPLGLTVTDSGSISEMLASLSEKQRYRQRVLDFYTEVDY